MGSLNPSTWPTQDLEAAESMLQHSRGARAVSSTPSYPLESPQPYAPDPAHLPNPATRIQLPPYSQFSPPLGQLTPGGSNASFTAVNDVKLPPMAALHQQWNAVDDQAFKPLPAEQDPMSTAPAVQNLEENIVYETGSHRRRSGTKGSIRPGGGSQRSHKNRAKASLTHESDPHILDQAQMKEEAEDKPAWAYEKTKAGKDRKRLPLACIACRRKKIRCSGEKPACKHCTRSRMPCVYKVTTRKATPRTDYMAMLDRRLKRMEDRVIKIIPKEGTLRKASLPRAVVKPGTAGHGHTSKKRGADEAFGTRVEDWVRSKPHPHAFQSNNLEGNSIMADGAEHLPTKEIQEHLSEVFFDFVYGQSYHLLHKPSYMKKLHAGTLAPVIVLAVCAVAARFSTHPQINSEPAYLRGEDWDAPASKIVLKRFDEPNIAILTATLILGLHEFGTCKGGSSWMFAGMATRMAHALQLHRELDHDPLGKENGKKNELSFTDREIRRRTMWACFMMDRFTASGTERPMYSDEEDIKVQLPIEESKFQMEFAGPTETLNGEANDLSSPTPSDLAANMGVAAYMVRAIALWGRVVKHTNMGGKEKDRLPVWDANSRFMKLKRSAADLSAHLPPNLKYNEDNLKSHSAQKLANQFIFLHVSLNQIYLVLHRFAVPTTPSGRPPKDMPKDFVKDALHHAIKSANQISNLLEHGLDHNVVAPFMGYCAFTSSTVHAWAKFSGPAALKAPATKYLDISVGYLRSIKKYWGVLHFMTNDLKEKIKKFEDAPRTNGKDNAQEDGSIFQFGDWFDKYPHGVSPPNDAGNGPGVKPEPGAASISQPASDTKAANAPAREPKAQPSKPKKPRKPAKPPPKYNDSSSSSQPPPLNLQTDDTRMMGNTNPHIVSDLPSTIPTSPFTPSPQMFSHPASAYSTIPNNNYGQYIPPNSSFIPQLDRQLVYGAYAGTEPTASTSASALDALTNTSVSQDFQPVSGDIWEGSPTMDMQQQQMMTDGVSNEYLGMTDSGAWFMPFNLQPPPGESGFGGPSG